LAHGHGFAPDHALFPAFAGLIENLYNAFGVLASPVVIENKPTTTSTATQTDHIEYPGPSKILTPNLLHSKILATDVQLKVHRLSANTASRKLRDRITTIEKLIGITRGPSSDTPLPKRDSSPPTQGSHPSSIHTVTARTRVGRVTKPSTHHRHS
jgi:hypothetical protein